MQRFIRSLVFVIVPFAGQHTADGETPGPVTAGPISSGGPAGGWMHGTGMDMFRQQPHFGQPDSATYGYRHYDMPRPFYGIWYRPRATEVGRYHRCSPDKFRPRGFGHLFYRRECGYRLDYAQYRLQHSANNYGPEYYGLQPDPRCEDCDHKHGHKH